MGLCSLATKFICKLMFYLLWQIHLAPLGQFRQISSRPDPGRANHNRLSDMGRVLYDDCKEERRWGIFVNNQDGCRWCGTVCWIRSRDSINQTGRVFLSKKNIQLHFQLLLIRKMCLPYFRQDLVKVYLINCVALIGCRSIQLCSEAFWSASVDITPWKSNMNWEVPD